MRKKYSIAKTSSNVKFINNADFLRHASKQFVN